MDSVARRAIRLSWGLVILLGLSTIAGASTLPYPGVYSAEAEKQFARGLEAYKKGRYSQARDHFGKLLESPLNQRSSAAQLMLARTFFRQGQHARALEAARVLEQRLPDSRYLFDARLVQGDAYFVLRRYFESATQYGRALVGGAPQEVQARAAERLAALVRNAYINEQGLAKLRAEVGEPRLRDALLFGEARWYHRLGWEAQSQAAMAAYLRAMPQGMFAPGAARRELGVQPAVAARSAVSASEGSRVRAGRRPRLGLLLPISGPQRQVGEDLQAGVQLANEEMGEPFELVSADIGTEYGDLPIAESDAGQLLRVAEQARHLVEEGVLAIVGPVHSASCVAAAVIAEAAGVPLVAPLAQQSGLDLMGSHVFQLSAVPEAQASVLAEYATLALGLRTLVVLAPLTDYGWSFEREFSRVAQAKGGRVVYVDWYVPEVTRDFQRIFEQVRRVGFGLAPMPGEAPAGSSAARAAAGEAPGGGGPSFLSELSRGDPALEAQIDRSTIFVDTIDGVAIVVESFDDATTIAPQLHFHRLRTQILGNDVWYQPDAVRQMRPGERSNVQGAILVAGHAESNPVTERFVSAFRRRFYRNPGYAAHGYDAGRLLMQAWQEGRRDSEGMREWLSSLSGYEGAAGRISFVGGRRTNSELAVLKIDQRGRIGPVEGEEVRNGTRSEEDLPGGVSPGAPR